MISANTNIGCHLPVSVKKLRQCYAIIGIITNSKSHLYERSIHISNKLQITETVEVYQFNENLPILKITTIDQITSIQQKTLHAGTGAKLRPLKVVRNSSGLLVQFPLARSAETAVELIDMQGRTVAKQTSGLLRAGRNEVPLSVKNPASGNYIARLRSGSTIMGEKVFVVK